MKRTITIAGMIVGFFLMAGPCHAMSWFSKKKTPQQAPVDPVKVIIEPYVAKIGQIAASFPKTTIALGATALIFGGYKLYSWIDWYMQNVEIPKTQIREILDSDLTQVDQIRKSNAYKEIIVTSRMATIELPKVVLIEKGLIERYCNAFTDCMKVSDDRAYNYFKASREAILEKLQ